MNTRAMQIKLEDYAPWVLIVFHAIGLGLFLSTNRPEGLSGFNMLLCVCLIYCSSSNWKQEAVLFLGIALGGFGIECIGVHTGLLFGTYAYGNELGAKIYAVPVVLGLNWYCIVAISAHVIFKWALPNFSLGLKALLAGLLCVGMDYLIEPVAMKYDFWNWKEGVIPFFNYVCWFVFSSLFAVWYLSKIEKTNPTAYFLFFVWGTFFFILNVF